MLGRSKAVTRAILVGLAVVLPLILGGVERDPTAEALTRLATDPIQTFYQDGVPHTDWTGQPRLTYEENQSFFPIGMYYTEPCRVDHGVQWTAFADQSHPFWTEFENVETYEIFVNLGTSANAGEGRVAQYTVAATPGPMQSAIIDKLPADTDLYFLILPNPWLGFVLTPPLAEGAFKTSPCPTTDVDDGNVVQTLSDGGFNLLVMPTQRLSFGAIHHPQLYIDLKQKAGIENFKFVANAAAGIYPFDFTEELFWPAPEGQGYSASPDIYGWQIEDIPLSLGAQQEPTCSPANLQASVDRLTEKYEAHLDATDQVLFHTEVAPVSTYFACNVDSFWDQSAQLGDAANHDYFVNAWEAGVPLPSLHPIAVSVGRQTIVVGEEKPSWFIVQAVSVRDNGFRTPKQTRATVYTAIIHGATGISYYVWDSFATRDILGGSRGLVGVRPTVPVSYPEQTSGFVPSQETIQKAEEAWRGITELNAELALLEPIILQKTSAEPYRVIVSEQANPWAPIRTMLKSMNGDLYLFAVNIDNAETDAEFRFERAVVSGEVLFEQRKVEITDRVVSDHFEPFDVHIYRLQLDEAG